MASQHRGWLTANVIAQLAFGLLSMTICLPSMQEWPAQFGASQASVQLTFSGYVLAYGGLQLVYGPLSDRVGRRAILLGGLALACVATTIAAFASSLWVLIAARALQGAGCAASMVMGRALVQDFFAGPERTRVMALVGMTMGFVPSMATLLGGQVHVRIGWQANFVLLSVLAVLLFIAAWRGLPASPVAPQAPRAATRGLRQLVSGYGQLARQPGFLGYVLLLSATTATFYAFLGGAPIVLAHYGVTPDRMGWYIMAPPTAYILGNFLTTRLTRIRSDFWLMTLGQGLTMAGLALVLVLGIAGPHTPLALSLPLILLGIGHGLLVPPSLTGTVGLVPALAGSAAAVAGVMQQFGGALGGYTVGLVPHEGQVNLALLMTAWTVAGGVALAYLGRVVRRG